MIKYVITTVAILIGMTLFGQEQSGKKEQSGKREKTMYAFTVTNVKSIDQLQELQSKMESMEFIEKVKLNYKEEKATAGQLIVFVNEPARTSEGQVMFSPIKLKKMIIEKGLSPDDIKTSKY